MSQQPAQTAPQTHSSQTITTEMTLIARIQQQAEPTHKHIRVSHEFLGGRFDIKG